MLIADCILSLGFNHRPSQIFFLLSQPNVLAYFIHPLWLFVLYGFPAVREVFFRTYYYERDQNSLVITPIIITVIFYKIKSNYVSFSIKITYFHILLLLSLFHCKRIHAHLLLLFPFCTNEYSYNYSDLSSCRNIDYF